MEDIIVLPDGYNGHTYKYYTTPIEIDGILVKLRCAEKGKEYMCRWVMKCDLISTK
jgi:hypothetical protein